MSEKISKQAKSELLEVLRQRYCPAAKQDKGKILDEFVAISGCHRKHAIRVLSGKPTAQAVREPRLRLYDAAGELDHANYIRHGLLGHELLLAGVADTLLECQRRAVVERAEVADPELFRHATDPSPRLRSEPPTAA